MSGNKKITKEKGGSGNQKLPVIREPMILAMETATQVSSVAVFEADQLLGHLEYHTQKLHAKLITLMAGHLLDDLGLKTTDLAGIAIASGPGSYTGLRVGVSAAKGYCLALDKPLLSISSLEALAWSVKDFAKVTQAKICPMIDARRMEVFCAWYNQDLEEKRPAAAVVIEEGIFDAELDEGKVIFIGDGAEKCRAVLEIHPNAIVLGARLSSAKTMGQAIWNKYQNERFENLVTFEPFYLKDFVVTKSKKKLL